MQRCSHSANGERCGASTVLDYKVASIIEDAVHALRFADGESAGMFHTISPPDQSYGPELGLLDRLEGENQATVLNGSRFCS